MRIMDNNKVVILGTAHGINTPGKCSPDKKFREYKFSREVINILKPKLEALGLTVYIDIQINNKCDILLFPHIMPISLG